MGRLFFLALLASVTALGNASYAVTAAQIAEVIGFSVPTGKSVIYVYRKQGALPGADSALRLNGIGVGETKPNTFMRFEVDPGQQTLTLESAANLRLDVETKVGESYFVLLGNNLALVDTNQGRENVLASRMLDNEFTKKSPVKTTSFAVVVPTVVSQTPPASAANTNTAVAIANPSPRPTVVAPPTQVRATAPTVVATPAPAPVPVQAAAPKVAPAPAPAPVPAPVQASVPKAVPAPAPAPAPAPVQVAVASTSVTQKPVLATPPAPVAMPAPVAKAVPSPQTSARAAMPYQLETIPFQAGVSSVTVENLAKKVGCRGGQGAGLITEKGPVEIYRMLCDNGTAFLARCEFRQCKQM